MNQPAPDHESLLAAARRWLDEDPDPATRAELESLLEAGDLDELRERFGSRLQFGTAGLRGVLGAGPNRMNRALIRRVTRGLAEYLLREVPEAATRGVVVAWDGRRLSPELAEDTVGVLAGAGIRVHRFDRPVSTPVCAFAVTHLGAVAAAMVTASHNPPEYNGYKVYWGNGAQIVPPHDRGISGAIDAVGPVPGIPLLTEEEARARGLLQDVPPALESAYVQGVLALQRHPESDRDLTIVYTPMHGVGGEWVRRTFREAGFDRLHPVPEQAEPDGEFPTVRFPNPEEPGALDLALALARDREADLILANDPDADRLAVVVRDHEGGFRPLSGNEIGVLLADYLLREEETSGNRLVATTIVSSNLLRTLAAEAGAAYAETLTGFKWIANRALELKEERGLRFVFGFEEALGYTVGELVRDKDGVGAALVFADLAAQERASGGSVLHALERIYRRHGFHASRQKSLTLPGSAGTRLIADMMASLRRDPPAEIGGSAVVAISDVKTGVRRDLRTGRESALEFPASNVLRYELADGATLLARPSGTEPKIKFYAEAVERFGPGEAFAEVEARAGERVAVLVEAVAADARGRVEG